MKYLIDFKNDTSDADIQQYFADNAVTVIRQFNRLGLVYETSADTEPPVTNIIEYVINDESQPITLLNRDSVSFNTVSDSEWWKMATLDLADYDQPTVNHILNSATVDVYVVDSGITASHPEFVGVNVETIYSYDDSFDDINGHGTAIASIIAGNTCSVTNANLKIVKIFGNAPLLQSHLLAAFDAIITRSSQSSMPSVVNLSWVIAKNPYVETKIQKLIDNNIAVVCSAGNSGTPIPDVTPASMFDVITVGAYNQEFEPCDFSNYTASGITVTAGSVNYGEIDVWSPGINIKAANLDGSYHIVSGTSIAAAIHSASLAFVYGAELSGDNPEFILSTSRIQNLITTAQPKKYAGCYRKNVLTLTGVYSSSVNRISTIFSKPEILNRYIFDLTATNVLGDAVDVMLFLKLYVTSYSMTKPLPTGLQLIDGHLSGSIDPSYLSDGEDYKIFTSDCQIQTVTGETTTSQINLLVKRHADINLEPINDPEIIVFLQSGPGCLNDAVCSETPCTAPKQKDTCVDTGVFGNCFCG